MSIISGRGRLLECDHEEEEEGRRGVLGQKKVEIDFMKDLEW